MSLVSTGAIAPYGNSTTNTVRRDATVPVYPSRVGLMTALDNSRDNARNDPETYHANVVKVLAILDQLDLVM